MSGGPNFVRYVAPVLAALKRLGSSGRPAEAREIVAEILSLPERPAGEHKTIVRGQGVLQTNAAAGQPRAPGSL